MAINIETSTEAVNPPTASTPITHTQLWNGIVYRIFNSHLTVPYIKSNRVIYKTDTEILLIQTLEENSTRDYQAGERVVTYKLSAPSKFEAHYRDDSYTFACTGIISEGSSGNKDLFWSLAWEWSATGGEEESAEHKERMRNNHKQTFRQVVDNTRKMVENGDL